MKETKEKDIGARLDDVRRMVESGTKRELREARETLEDLADDLGEMAEEGREDLQERYDRLKRRIDRKLD